MSELPIRDFFTIIIFPVSLSLLVRKPRGRTTEGGSSPAERRVPGDTQLTVGIQRLTHGRVRLHDNADVIAALSCSSRGAVVDNAAHVVVSHLYLYIIIIIIIIDAEIKVPLSQ